MDDRYVQVSKSDRRFLASNEDGRSAASCLSFLLLCLFLIMHSLFSFALVSPPNITRYLLLLNLCSSLIHAINSISCISEGSGRVFLYWRHVSLESSVLAVVFVVDACVMWTQCTNNSSLLVNTQVMLSHVFKIFNRRLGDFCHLPSPWPVTSYCGPQNDRDTCSCPHSIIALHHCPHRMIACMYPAESIIVQDVAYSRYVRHCLESDEP